MNKSKDTKKVDARDEDLERMRRRFKQQQARKEGGSDEGDSSWLKLQPGRNMVRVLPRPGTSQFYIEAPVHYRVGPDQATVRCIDPEAIDDKNGRPKPQTRCPVCKKFVREQRAINSKYERGSERGKEKWLAALHAYSPKGRSIMNVLDKDGSVKKMSAGPMIMEQLLSYYFEEDSEIGDFTALDSGRWMKIKRVGEKRNTKYEVRPSTDTEDITDRWDEIKEQLHDLDAACGEMLSAEEIKAVMEGSRDEDDASDDDDEGSAEDASDDESADEDDDASAEDESDEAPEDDDDEPAPRGRRRNREDRW